jgi:hypothetical protein
MGTHFSTPLAGTRTIAFRVTHPNETRFADVFTVLTTSKQIHNRQNKSEMNKEIGILPQGKKTNSNFKE